MEGNCQSSGQSSFNNYVHLVYLLIKYSSCAYHMFIVKIQSLNRRARYFLWLAQSVFRQQRQISQCPLVVPTGPLFQNGVSTDLFFLVSRMLAKCSLSHHSTTCWQLLAVMRLILLLYCFAINCSWLNVYILWHLLMSCVIPAIRIPQQEKIRPPWQCNTQRKGNLLLTRARAPAANNAVVQIQRAPSPSFHAHL